MPAPIVIGLAIAAGATGLGGIGFGVHGGVKMKKANTKMKSVKERHENNIKRFELKNKATNLELDKLGNLELEILSSFTHFSELIEKIQNKPKFENLKIGNYELQKYKMEELEKVAIGAGVLLGSVGGAAIGTAGAFAAAGATQAAVHAVGIASTGAAISGLHGAALSNATLAALGGGSIAAGGGGVALGTVMLGVAATGVALLVGGIIFSFTGKGLDKKADLAVEEVDKEMRAVDKIYMYLNRLTIVAMDYKNILTRIFTLYNDCIKKMEKVIIDDNITDWVLIPEKDKTNIKNTIMLVSLLFQMCKLQLVIQTNKEDELNKINYTEYNENRENALLLEKELLNNNEI